MFMKMLRGQTFYSQKEILDRPQKNNHTVVMLHLVNEGTKYCFPNCLQSYGQYGSWSEYLTK